MKLFFFLERYIKSLGVTLIPTMFERLPPSKEALISYLVTHLSLSKKYKETNKFEFFIEILEEALSSKLLTKNDFSEIFHTRKVGHQILDSNLLDICVKNIDQNSAAEIVKFEIKIHKDDKSSLLHCTRHNIANEDLKQWIVREINGENNDNDCLGNIGIKKTKKWIPIGTVLLSMLFYAMDQERQIYIKKIIKLYHDSGVFRNNASNKEKG